MVDVASSLTSALGISSGINTTQLVADLTSATYGPKLDNLNSLMSSNSAKISALASAKSSLTTFSDALTKLLQSATYSGQPVSNDTSIASVTPTGTGKVTGLPAQIEVQQLASAQVLQSTALNKATDTAGAGTLTLAVGTKTYDITLTNPATTLNDLANKINDAKSGVTASIVTDQSGARLVLKGDTGVSGAFTLVGKTDPDTGTSLADANLQRFTFDGTTGNMTRSQEAQNAKIKIDNVAMEFDKNETTTAIPNLRIDFNRAAPGTTVTLATDQPTSSMNDLVKEIVDAYNTLKSSLNTAMRAGDGTSATSVGLLTNDSGVRTMSNMLARLTSTQLTPDGDYKTLADIGVTTNRDGTLTLDNDRLTKALAADPAGVVEMLNPSAPDTTHVGIGGALKSMSDYLTGTDGPLSSSSSTYDKLAKNYQSDIDKINTQKSAYSDQLTATYGAMQTKLLQFKATQSYLEQQIAAWNS